MDLPAIIEQCTDSNVVHPQTMQALIQNESSGNPLAIATVGTELSTQANNKADAVEMANSLIKQGYNVSLGLGQINMHNFKKVGLTVESAFDPCKNLKASESILSSCYDRAIKKYKNDQDALQAALSCYYSNNFSRGLVADDTHGGSYIDRVAVAHSKIPNIQFDRATLNGGTRAKGEGVPMKRQAVRPKQDAIESFEQTSSWDVFDEFKQGKQGTKDESQTFN